MGGAEALKRDFVQWNWDVVGRNRKIWAVVESQFRKARELERAGRAMSERPGNVPSTSFVLQSFQFFDFPLQRSSSYPALVEYCLEKRSKQFTGVVAFLILTLGFDKIS
jgi:hypothetical protein